MSDKQNEKEVKGGLSRRGFLGASAVTGAAVAATAFGGAVMSRETWAAAVKEAKNKVHVAPGELDEYYGFWSGGHQGEVRVQLAVTDDMMPGAVALCHGWGHQQAEGLRVASRTEGCNVNVLARDGPGSLEPISGMAQLNGIVVEVRASAFCPTSALTRVDLPALGAPSTATRPQRLTRFSPAMRRRLQSRLPAWRRLRLRLRHVGQG